MYDEQYSSLNSEEGQTGQAVVKTTDWVSFPPLHCGRTKRETPDTFLSSNASLTSLCRLKCGYGHELVAGLSWARVLLSLKTRRVDEAIPPTDVVVRKNGFQLRCPPRLSTKAQNYEVIPPKCLSGPPVDCDRLNAHRGYSGNTAIMETWSECSDTLPVKLHLHQGNQR
ncbi:hypothetical protein TNCV_1449951 [Trichonephila clavipes]|nr:hypothetical protein TNCV_1449951 [Trichonephila clavipes]